MTAPLVRAENVSRSFASRSGWFARRTEVKAVREVDITVGRGEALGVVGESGCGKSTLGRMLLHLLPPTSGRVFFDGHALQDLAPATRRRLRARMQMIFQDPYGSLDPRRRAGEQIADGIMIHGLADPTEARARVADLLQRVGLDPAHGDRLPHEFSGGQRQRIAIARALATTPDFIVADEPVSALDVSVQAQIVTLMAELRSSFGLALLFISHDLHVVRHLCERVVVMYLGRVVEEGDVSEIFRRPAHPYTRALTAATPSIRPRSGKVVLSGDLPNPAAPPSGCVFRTRCPHAVAPCAESIPALRQIARGRRVACLRDDIVAQHG
ncbi:oligopeptide/dipeptide ABC transporter ATP-binding protein [Bradyrhizobium prioriisuperbiae]|uniref:ABC transporter ATP-binding protein n=1 Tax=Bradyrhizobium prioriisuperbiae TaxID=2854389 RepID=UPI0028E8B869|nr:oligopeptide/dipeptide ABC transporter ATP-binding protein [Bradyrhizobium prioritasuperba]